MPNRDLSRNPKKTAALYKPTAASLDHANNVGYLIKQAYSSITRMVDSRVAPLDLTSIQWRPLVLLRYGNIDTPAELARQINVDSGAMTRTLDRLEAKGFLTRRRSHEDRRVVKLELTSTGNDVVASILPIVAGSLNNHLNGFTQAELDQLLGFLHRLIENGTPVNDASARLPAGREAR